MQIWAKPCSWLTIVAALTLLHLTLNDLFPVYPLNVKHLPSAFYDNVFQYWLFCYLWVRLFDRPSVLGFFQL